MPPVGFEPTTFGLKGAALQHLSGSVPVFAVLGVR